MNASRAICTLESMAIDMVGTLGGLSETNPIATVLERQIEAINMAQDALRAVRDLATNENASHISIDRMNEILQAEREGRLVILPCRENAELKMNGNTYRGDHWNHTLTAFRDDPTTRSGKQVTLFSIEAAEKALEEANG